MLNWYAPAVPAHFGEYIVYVLYVLLGPTAWTLFLIMMLRGRQRVSLLQRRHANPHE